MHLLFTIIQLLLLVLVTQGLQPRHSYSRSATELTGYLSVHNETKTLRKFALATVKIYTNMLEFASHSAPFVISKLVELAQRLLRHLHPIHEF